MADINLEFTGSIGFREIITILSSDIKTDTTLNIDISKIDGFNPSTLSSYVSLIGHLRDYAKEINVIFDLKNPTIRRMASYGVFINNEVSCINYRLESWFFLWGWSCCLGNK